MSKNNKSPEIRFKGFTDEWEIKLIGDCFTERKDRSNEGELLSVTINKGIVKFSETGRFNNSSADKSNYKVVKIDDIAYNSMRMWQGALGVSKYDGIVSPAYTVLIPADFANPLFFAYTFKMSKMLSVFQRFSQGLTSDTWNLKFPALSEIEIFVPTTQEQTKISSLFFKIENIITLYERKLTKLEHIKKSMLIKLFPEKNEKKPEIRFADFKDNWKVYPLKDIVEEVKRSDPAFDAPLMMISSKNGFIKQSDRYSYDNSGESKNKYTLLKRGELAYNHGASKLRPFGSTFVLEEEAAHIPFVYHSFNVKNSDPKFMEIVLNGIDVENQLRKIISSGARMDGLLNISFKEYSTIEVLIPTLDEQKVISSYFTEIDTLLDITKRKINKLKAIKESLLDKMFV